MTSQLPRTRPRRADRLSVYGVVGAVALSGSVALGSLIAWLPSFVSHLYRGTVTGVVGGNDYAMYHTAASMFASGDWADAYSLAGLASAMNLRLGAASFAYPPMLAQVIQPLTVLSYQHALAVWFIASLLCLSLVPAIAGRNGMIALVAFGFPIYVALRFGQFVPFAVAALMVALFALRRQRVFLAGLAIGFLVFKPQFLVGPFLIAVFDPESRKMLKGMVTSATSISLFSLLASPDAWKAFVTGLQETAQPNVSSSWDYSLLTVAKALPDAAQIPVYAVVATIIAVLAVRVARSVESLEAKVAVGIILSVAVSPRMVVYDWTILAVAAVGLAPLIRTSAALRWAAAIVVVGGLSGHPSSPGNVGWLAFAVAFALLVATTSERQGVVQLKSTERTSP